MVYSLSPLIITIFPKIFYVDRLPFHSVMTSLDTDCNLNRVLTEMVRLGCDFLHENKRKNDRINQLATWSCPTSVFHLWLCSRPIRVLLAYPIQIRNHKVRNDIILFLKHYIKTFLHCV